MTMTHGYNAADAGLAYATPVARPSQRAWAGAAIVLGGLGLVVLGGCFLIGVLLVVSGATPGGLVPPPAPLSGAQLALMAVLYVPAFASFAGAAVMLAVGTRGLLKILSGHG